MIRLALAALIGALWLGAGALAQQDEPTLDTLFERLRDAGTEDEAKAARAAIVERWTTSGDAQIDELMAIAEAAMQRFDLHKAEEALDHVVAGAPHFVEGWNRRATVRWLARDFDGSLADIEETLAREPRHFGALSGRAKILLYERKDKRGALEALRAVAALNPHFEGMWVLEELEAELQ